MVGDHTGILGAVVHSFLQSKSVVAVEQMSQARVWQSVARVYRKNVQKV